MLGVCLPVLLILVAAVCSMVNQRQLSSIVENGELYIDLMSIDKSCRFLTQSMRNQMRALETWIGLKNYYYKSSFIVEYDADQSKKDFKQFKAKHSDHLESNCIYLCRNQVTRGVLNVTYKAPLRNNRQWMFLSKIWVYRQCFEYVKKNIFHGIQKHLYSIFFDSKGNVHISDKIEKLLADLIMLCFTYQRPAMKRSLMEDELPKALGITKFLDFPDDLETYINRWLESLILMSYNWEPFAKKLTFREFNVEFKPRIRLLFDQHSISSTETLINYCLIRFYMLGFCKSMSNSLVLKLGFDLSKTRFGGLKSSLFYFEALNLVMKIKIWQGERL